MKYLKLIVLLFFVISCDDIIEVEDISDKTITILAPTDTSVLTLTDVTFSWNTVEDAEQYKLQIAVPNFESATQIVLDTIITNSNFTKTLEFGDYEWRIRAENAGFQTKYTTQSFIVEE
ncbi:hypothetical protein DIS18_05410 [Algibacter marinivivus]|uniref:Fibronectin type-III domain-containing protein n=1 Tax=Algibacter marinivivus TaxID=2100723 RepID=A0A2U2X875_9FLAO|nr:hypothetical protein [Algibacter marinivivus]PWH83986.1 hypothetical protein DIS18_05410 [Algibacter marinivivus]